MTEKDKQIQDYQILVDKLIDEISELKLENIRLTIELKEWEDGAKESRDITDFEG